MKRPSFQFYPADWRKDPALRSCSMAARGLWADMLCIAHESEEYGVMTINGRPLDAKQLARMVGELPSLVTKLLAELDGAGVFSRNESGAIYSRRMVRDEALRVVRAEGGKDGASHGYKGAEHGKKGGRPRKETGDKKPPLNPPPSSSSSSSTSVIASGSSLPSGTLEASDTHRASAREAPQPTAAGEACRAMREAGLPTTSPSHPKLIQLIAAGATTAQFAHAAAIAVGKDRGFAYALGVLEGQLADAAKPIRPGASNADAVHDHNRRIGRQWLEGGIS